MKKGMLICAALLLTAGCGRQNDDKMDVQDFKWQIDRFDDVKVLRYQVPDFDSLSLRQKKLVYYLSQAALCGRDILYDQKFALNLPIRKTLEEIYLSYGGDNNDPRFKAFEKYLKKVWFANGIHHHYSNDKFVPGFTESYFDSLAASTPSLNGKEELLALIKPAIFDPELYRSTCDQSDGIDMVTSSANNYYDGVTQKEAEEYYASLVDSTDPRPVMAGLNSRLVKRDGKIYEEVWRLDGTYSPAIEKITYWLEKAATVAENPAQKATIEALVSYYKSGDLKEFDRYSILWLEDGDSQVDFVNGFIESYGDPLGYKGSWEANVNFKNIEATKRTEVLSRNAQWFEDNSPVDSAYKKEEVKGVSAKVITVAQLGGDAYPATPIGINLPNSDWIRRDHGSKSVTIQNITHAYNEVAEGNGFADEFTLRDEDKELARKYGALAGDLHTDMHECLGHGSGKLAPGIKGDELKNYGSTLEEARADLFALYYLGDDKLVELGIVPNKDVMKAGYYNAIFNGIMGQLTRIEPGKNIAEAHMRDRQLIARWCYEHGKDDNVIEFVIPENGKKYVVINDYDKLRDLFGELLREVQRIKSEGDFEAGRRLVEDYGVTVDPELHNEVLERFAKLDIAPYSGFVNPVFTPVDKDGKIADPEKEEQIADIKISYPDDYTEQMLGYSRNYSFL